jgi:tripartite ATP-independent transporter DctM subunit
MVAVWAYARARNYPVYARATVREFFVAFGRAAFAILTPVIVIGGVVGGFVTPTEASVIAVLYSLAVGLIIYRSLGVPDVGKVLYQTGRLASISLFCIGTASAFGWLLAYYQIPKALLAGVATWGMGPIATGFFIAGVFLVVGCFLDAIPAIVIVGTVLEPLAKSVGMDPIHFAIVGIVALAFGLVTPPYGLCLMISAHVAKMRIVDALKDVMIMLIPMFVVLALIIIFPQIPLFLPRLFPPGTL